MHNMSRYYPLVRVKKCYLLKYKDFEIKKGLSQEEGGGVGMKTRKRRKK